LLCAIAGEVFGQRVRSWSRSPKAYAQCLSNVQKAVEALRRCKGLPAESFFGGLEDDIVRGEWSVIVGFLYELCRSSQGGAADEALEEREGEKNKRKYSGDRKAAVDLVPGYGQTQSDALDIAEEDPEREGCAQPQFPDKSRDLVPTPAADGFGRADGSGAEAVKRDELKEHSDWLDEALGIAGTSDREEITEIGAMLSESISSKLIREIDDAIQSNSRALDRQRARLATNREVQGAAAVAVRAERDAPKRQPTSSSAAAARRVTDIAPGMQPLL
jgi:hypothetical protein